MKKIVAFALVSIMVFAMTACGKEAADNNQTSNDSQKETVSSVQENENGKNENNENNEAGANNETEQGNVEVNPVMLLFHPATSGSYATIKVDSSVKMDDTSAWLGLCPAGKDYITELEADDADVIWFALDARETDDDPYVWACDFEPVEDGTYALVVATSDDENVGYIAIQLTMTKNGDSLTFDYDNAKLNERP